MDRVLLAIAIGVMMMGDRVAAESGEHGAKLRHADGSWKYTNRLIDETSPYLLQHAHNPVQWYAWGEEAFAEARRSGRSIFLSVGYSTCYWCHVMERKVFENPEIAAVMNELYVNVKVDREERPDVDDVYMMAVQVVTRQGGWPMSVFLTPPGAGGEDDAGLKPFWAGTYIPPTAQYGRPGFVDLLRGLNEVWVKDKAKVVEQADRIAGAVEGILGQRFEPGEVDVKAALRAGEQLMAGYDSQDGGYGGAPKFPQVSYLRLLMGVYERTKDERVGKSLAYTFERMARGGMYDQVGGGFHRYSTDEKWLVPHYEKMLYDNGQLAEAYLWARESGLAVEGDQGFYERVARGICDYVLREMTDETGALWSAQDAEVDGLEGGNYVWRKEEVEKLFEDVDVRGLVLEMYGLDGGVNFKDPHVEEAEPGNVLYLPVGLGELANSRGMSLQELLEVKGKIDEKLYDSRMKRKQPAVDDKVLAGWNGLMIGGLAKAGKQLGEERYYEAAVRAADAILEHMRDDEGGLYRTMRGGKVKISAFLDDYAFVMHGLIELYRADGNERWLEEVKVLLGIVEARLKDEGESGGGGYYDTLAGQGDLFVRTRGSYDGAIPTGNSQMVHNLLDLFEVTGDRKYLDMAERDLRSWAKVLGETGQAMANMQYGVLRYAALAGVRVTSGQARRDVQEREDREPVVVGVEPGVMELEGGKGRFVVRMAIGEGYHVNAHRPGVEGLIGTELKLGGEGDEWELKVEYPQGKEVRFAFADEAIKVYEGEVEIKGEVSRHTLESLRDTEGVAPESEVSGMRELRLRLRYQVCTEDRCLPPRDVVLEVGIKE